VGAKETIELHKNWLARTNKAPLVEIYAPVEYPFGGFDVEVAPAEIAERKLRNAEAGRAIPTDKLPAAFVDFGPPFLPALGGAGFEHDGVNCWSVPCAETAKDLRVKPFDPAHPLWVRYVALFEKLLDNWSWDSYLPGIFPMLGPMDVLSCMLGQEALSMELCLHGEDVRRVAADAARLFMDVFKEQIRMLRQAGFAEGSVDWMRIWMPGDSACYSEDYSALVGPQHFRDFFYEPNSTIMTSLDTAFLHVHSAAHKCLPEIIALRGINAIELSNDPNGPGMDELIELGKSVQDAQLALQMSNWEHPLEVSEIDKLLTSLEPEGLVVSLQASSLEEARDLYALAKG